MKPYLIIAICLLLPLTTTAKDKNKGNQLPKVTSYDREGKPLHEGVAFFISSDGDVLTTFTALQDAWSADVTDAKGKHWKVERVYGASDLYDMVKLRTDCAKANAYKLSENQPKLKDALFIVGPDGKQTRATVNESKTYEGITYYTLATPTDDSQTGCPVINDKGQVVAVIQKNAEKDKSLSYAADIAVEKELHVNALSAALTALNSIHIPKQLPDDAKQAASYLYLIAKNSTDTLTYLTGLADYIALFPKDITGYADRATYYAQNNRFDLAEADYDAALKNVSDQSAVHYSLSKLIYQLNMYKSYQQYKDWDLNRALSEAQTAQQLSPGILNQLQVGNCHYALKQYQQALDNYQAVNATPAASPQTFFYAAKSREMLDNDSTAVLALLDSAMSRFHEPYNSEAAPFLYQRAQYRAKYGQYRTTMSYWSAPHASTTPSSTRKNRSISSPTSIPGPWKTSTKPCASSRTNTSISSRKPSCNSAWAISTKPPTPPNRPSSKIPRAPTPTRCSASWPANRARRPKPCATCSAPRNSATPKPNSSSSN